MVDNFSKTIWQGIVETVWQIIDALYRTCVRLLYHSKIVGVFALIAVIIFLTSCGFFISIFYENHHAQYNTQDIQNDKNSRDASSGFYVIDVGQGDSLLYITKENQTFLIDTGKPGDGIVQKLENILGKYRKKIDVVLLTHPDSDHVGEINNILSSFNVGLILYSPIYDVRPDSKKSIDEIKNKNKGLTLPIFAGSNLVFSENKNKTKDVGNQGTRYNFENEKISESAYFLSPSFSGMTTFINKKEIAEDNYFSVVAMIENKDAIFAMADAPQKIEKVLASNSVVKSTTSMSAESPDIFESTSSLATITGRKFARNDFDKIILKVGHHGSKTSSAPEFIQALSPTDAVLSYGLNNRYGHPNKETLDTLDALSGAPSSLSSSSSSVISIPKIKIHRTISGTVYFNE